MAARFSTRDIRQRRIPADIEAWSETGAPSERRTLVVQLSTQADLAEVQAALEKLGVEVVSAGRGAMVGVMPCDAVRPASQLPGVVRLQVPTRLDLKHPQGLTRPGDDD